MMREKRDKKSHTQAHTVIIINNPFIFLSRCLNSLSSLNSLYNELQKVLCRCLYGLLLVVLKSTGLAGYIVGKSNIYKQLSGYNPLEFSVFCLELLEVQFCFFLKDVLSIYIVLFCICVENVRTLFFNHKI